VLKQGFGSAQVLDECNFLVEYQTHNWIVTNASAADGVHVVTAGTPDELGAVSEGTRAHRLTPPSREFTTMLLVTTWSIFPPAE
jgi:hypothetical protein